MKGIWEDGFGGLVDSPPAQELLAEPLHAFGTHQGGKMLDEMQPLA